MTQYSLAHLSDGTLLRDLNSLVARDRANTAELLAHLAEVDARRLYLPAGYPSMFDWCVGHLGLSDDSAYKRIRAARAARLHPAIFHMVADGRLTLGAVVLLAPRLTTADADDLLAAATGLSKSDLERLLAERFPKRDLPAMVTPLGAGASTSGMIEPASGTREPAGSMEPLAPGPVQVDVNPLREARHDDRARLAPIATGRYALQMTIDQHTHDQLRRAQDLLGHAVPAGDLARVLGLALDALVERLEKRRCAATEKPRRVGRCHAEGTRHVPAEVKRLVWERDGGRCTFVSEAGHRCEARRSLELDHIEPFARGGTNTPSNLRLRCRAHNQFEAERTYGAGFMRHQRDEAKRRAAEARDATRTAERESKRAAEAQAREAAQAAERERQAALQARRDELIPFLRHLGYSLAESRLASTVCDTMPDASLEQRLRAALQRLLPAGVRIEQACERGAA